MNATMVKLGENTYPVMYTFRSSRYLDDFDITSFEDMKTKPFKMYGVTLDLLYAGMNFGKTHYTKEQVEDLLEVFLADTPLTSLFEILVNELMESDFFKNLQLANPEQ